jgi:hypothetical protein
VKAEKEKVMALIAVITNDEGTVAPVDDSGRHFDSVKLYQTEKGGDQRAVFPFQPKAPDFDLRAALVLAHVTDVIAQHYEEGCFTKLKTAGLRLWLEAPGFTPHEALDAFHAGHLPEATVGAHVVHGPEGRNVRREEREPQPARQLSRNSEPVITPMRGGQSLI